MKAPDKIYVNIPGDYWHPGTDEKVDTDTEYIRKDVLLEWAKKENLKFNHIGDEQDDNFARGIAAGLGYLISNLSSL